MSTGKLSLGVGGGIILALFVFPIAVVVMICLCGGPIAEFIAGLQSE